MSDGALPRGPLLPAQRDRDHRAAPARAARGRAAARRSLPRPLLREERPAAPARRRAARSIACSDYAWPGNVRELENVIERAVVLSRSDTLTEQRSAGRDRAGRAARADALTFEVGTPLDEIELRVIRETLRHTKGDKSRRRAAPRHLDAHDLPQARRRERRGRRGAAYAAQVTSARKASEKARLSTLSRAVRVISTGRQAVEASAGRRARKRLKIAGIGVACGSLS